MWVPDSPTIEEIAILSPSSVSVAFAPSTQEDANNPITSYSLRYSSSEQGLAESPMVLDVPTSQIMRVEHIVVEELTPGTGYYFQLFARNALGESLGSQVEFELIALVPGAPGQLNVEPAGASAVELSWSPPSDPGSSELKSYTIAVQSGVQKTTITVVARGTERMQYKVPVVLGELYELRVSATNADGEGEFSLPVEYTHGGCLVFFSFQQSSEQHYSPSFPNHHNQSNHQPITIQLILLLTQPECLWSLSLPALDSTWR